MLTPTISQLVYEYYDQHKDDLPGLSTLNPNDENELIKLIALSFMTYHEGKLYQDITDDSNLNTEIINHFCQTFIRHFWNNQIGYDDENKFYVKLRAFLDEQLPIWGQFYKQAVLDKSAFFTSTGLITTTNNGLLHIDGTHSQNVQNSGNVTTTNDLKSSSNTTQQHTGNDSTTHTYDTQQSEKAKNSSSEGSFTADADRPQDQLNSESLQGTDAENPTDPLKAYDFQYASSAEGTRSLNKQNNQSTQTQTGTQTDDTTYNSNVNTNTTGTQTGNVSTENNTQQALKGQNSQEQQNSNASVTNTYMRNENIGAIAKQLNSLVNGIYLDIFRKAKKAGLFLLIY